MIETEWGAWVAALAVAGYTASAMNPLSVARYRERHSTSGAKSDAADAHLLAEIVRVDRAPPPRRGLGQRPGRGHQARRPHAPESGGGADPHVLRLRSTLRDFFPAALQAFSELDAGDTLEIVAAAPDPDSAARLPCSP